MTFGLACCAVEMMHAAAARYDECTHIHACYGMLLLIVASDMILTDLV